MTEGQFVGLISVGLTRFDCNTFVYEILDSMINLNLEQKSVPTLQISWPINQFTK